MIEFADERPPRRRLTLRQLAECFCAENELTRDLAAPNALEYRQFLSQFLEWVKEHEATLGYDGVLRFRRGE